MVSKLHSWWQKVKKPLEIAVVSIFIVGLIILIILSVLGAIFQWNWTGFGAETSDPKQHAKTLWDWLQLLIIPAVLAIGGYLFNLTTSRNEQKNTQLRDQTERDISSDNQREAALQAYIDKISDLLLDRKLRESAEDDEVRNIARVRTLTVLPQLDNARKRSILQFLYESGLLDKEKRILNLSGANLADADLSKANLILADLSGANLSGANLSFTYLSGADLSGVDLAGANLSKANLADADLAGANLSKANLAGASLSGVNLSFAYLIETNLAGASLTEADLSFANLTGADLTGADLTGADLPKATMSGRSTHN